MYFVNYVKKECTICTDKSVDFHQISVFDFQQYRLHSHITGLLSFAFLHAGATKTRDPEVFMRIILLRSEIIFQNLISRLKCIFGISFYHGTLTFVSSR